MTRRGASIVVAAIVLVATALAYLRDPPWLPTMTSGLYGWTTGESGIRYRWMAPHASFFVPSDAHVVEIPLRALVESPAWPVVATVTLDDRAVDRIVLSDSSWRRSIFRMPPPSGRRVRRIDIRLDRVRDESRGAQVGEVVTR